MKRILYLLLLFVWSGMLLCSCSSDDTLSDGTLTFVNDESGSGTTIDSTITDYDGELADDKADDVVGTDEDFYWEANTFSNTVDIVYSSSGATVTVSNSNILYDINGAHVTIDMLTISVKNVNITNSGSSCIGSLKIYGDKKFMLTMNGVDLTSKLGPAINSQCKKRMFFHLNGGTTYYLTDCSSYSNDTYYHSSSTADDEDRKGCFFSEGNMIFSSDSGSSLVVKGNYKHGIVTDGYFWMRPGVTIAVTDAAKNAIHVKGDEDDGIGVTINGGLIYTKVSSTAGKGIKTDLDVVINGGKLLLNTTGGSEYDSDEQDTSSPACIKADGNVEINDGTLTLKSSGTGGKGISVDTDLVINGGTINVTTTGGKYVYDEKRDLTSSPKGVKVDGDITINGGNLNIEVTGVSDGSEGLESKSNLTINDGEVYIYAYDDAMNGSTDVTINGGKVFAYGINNDGIDSNGTLNVTGGLVIASGCSSPEEGFDCDSSNKFKVTGGTLIGTGGAALSPSSSSSQCTIIYGGISATIGTKLCIRNSSGTVICAYSLPRTMNGMTLLFSSPDITKGTSYTLLTGGSVSGYTSEWNGWYEGASWSGGSSLKTFSVNSTVTTVDTSSYGTPGGGRFW